MGYWMLAAPAVVPAAGAEPNWDRLAEETLTHLQALIRIDTSNPPGNELEAARYLKGVLDREGIPSTLIETAPGRGALVARLRATHPNPQEPLLMLGHLDVVGVERAKWQADPFAAEVKDGVVWGRGALDDKGMLAAELVTLLELKRQGTALKRDVVFLAGCDEEAGGGLGMDVLAAEHFEKLRAGFALNEGGRILERNSKVVFVGIQNSEKSSHTVTLVARGSSGHASLPHPGNPVARLSAAVARLAAFRAPARLTPTTEQFFANLARAQDAETAVWMRQLAEPGRLQEAADELSRRSLHWNALLRNTVTPTILAGGFRSNVIPDEARATLNIRLLPGESHSEFVQTLERVVDDPQLEFVYDATPGPEPPAMPTEGEFYRALERVAGEMFPEAVVTPYMHQATTDSGPLRRRGVQTYGLLIFPITEEELLLLHASNERLRLSSLRRGTEFLYRLVREFATEN